jgi:hypothetical protein
MLDIRMILSKNFPSFKKSLNNFVKNGPTMLVSYLDRVILITLQQERERIKSGLISNNLGLISLSPKTIARKRYLVTKGLVTTNPKIPLVRLKEIYNSIDIIQVRPGHRVLFVSDKIYDHLDTPNRKTSRTVGDIVLIHKSGNLGPAGNKKRDIFPEVFKTNLKQRALESVSRGVKYFIKGI